ncbi:MAG TPA: APC family permease [Steroidobacteraceae bacterium]|nr:APC family permease [Steroidobacteraceae bacterium]
MSQLKPNCLSFSELLAQAVALISPTMTAALIIPVMYSNTGDWSWLPYALGTVMLLFVAYNLNQFARRSTGAGSMYAYICRGLGLKAGAIGGWALIWAYLGISMAGVTGFTIFAGKLLAMTGITAPPILLFAVCVGIAAVLAWKNVQLSAILMLVLEGVSVAFILGLCAIVLMQHPLGLDAAQFNTRTVPWSNIGLGVVVAIFSLVGFECATAFGDEARNPLKSIPRAVNLSLIISGLFFMFVTYVMVMSTRGYSTTLDKLDAPLNTMAQLAHVPLLQIPLSLGAMVSFFALCLSCLNAGARVIYAMGRHGLFHASTSVAHPKNETPHVGVAIMAALAFIVPTVSTIGGVATLDLFGDVGTCAAFGFVVAYFLITVAAPVYLRRVGALKTPHLIGCAASLALLIVPAVGSVYPVPPAPVKYFPYAFLVYLVIGLGWILTAYGRKPQASALAREDLERAHSRFQRESVVSAAVTALAPDALPAHPSAQ